MIDPGLIELNKNNMKNVIVFLSKKHETKREKNPTNDDMINIYSGIYSLWIIRSCIQKLGFYDKSHKCREIGTKICQIY